MRSTPGCVNTFYDFYDNTFYFLFSNNSTYVLCLMFYFINFCACVFCAKEEKPKRFGFKEKNEPTKQIGSPFESKLKKTEKTSSRENVPSNKADEVQKQEAEKKLQELKRRRNDAESEELEKMKQKQQGAEAELEELKKKREERRKVMEEEEKQKKQELEEKKAKEQEEKKRMKEEIEKRRAEAAEKKKQMEEESGKPAFTISPKGSSKIGEKAGFLNKSAQKSTPSRVSHTPIVSKIGNRMEQYASAVQGQREVKSPKSTVADIPSGGARNIKNMWEKGNISGSSESPSPANKDLAGIKVGVAGRVNSWMAKPAEPEKTAAPAPVASSPAAASPAAKPADQKPGDIGNKRGMWETKKGSTPAKVAVGGKGKW
uniref:Caldesmon 1b n=1 Tax=Sphaeramia orbicularis TaxID=375764 RepID=A0A673BXF0_9TELE